MERNHVIIAIILVIIIIYLYKYYIKKWWKVTSCIFDNLDAKFATFPQPYSKPVQLITSGGYTIIVPYGVTKPYAWPEFGGKYLVLVEIEPNVYNIVTSIDYKVIDSDLICAKYDEGWKSAPILFIGNIGSPGSRWAMRKMTCNPYQRCIKKCGQTPVMNFMSPSWPDWASWNEQMIRIITPVNGSLLRIAGTLTNVMYKELVIDSAATAEPDNDTSIVPNVGEELYFNKYYFGLETMLGPVMRYILIPSKNHEMEFFIYVLSSNSPTSLKQIVAVNALKYTESTKIDTDTDKARWILKLKPAPVDESDS